MPSNETRDELEALLREYNDDDDFVEGVLYEASTEDDMTTMIKFINTARQEHDDSVTQDELILLSIALAEKRDKQTSS